MNKKMTINVLISACLYLGLQAFCSASELVDQNINSVYRDDSTGYLYAGSRNGLYISEDNGADWFNITTANGLLDNDIKDVIAHGDDVYVICGDYNGLGYYAEVSHDLGQSWQQMDQTYLGGYRNLGYSNGKVYLFANYDYHSGVIPDYALLVSQDNANSWSNVPLPTDLVEPNYFNVSGDNLSFVDSWTSRVYVSSNEGEKWEYNTIYTPNGDRPYLHAVESREDELAIATDHGVFTSDASMSHINFVSDGLPVTDVYHVALDSYGKVYAGTQSGMGILSPESSSSHDKFVTYTKGDNTQLPGNIINDVYSDKTLTLVGTNDGLAIYTNKITYHWNPDTSYPLDVTSGVLLDNKAYFGNYGQVSTCNDSSGCNLNGMVLPEGTEYNVTGSLVSDNLSSYQLNTIVYNGSSSGIASNYVTSVAQGDGALYVGTVAGLSVSYDDGITWQYLGKNTGLTNAFINSVAVNDENIYAATNGGGLAISADKGSSWKMINHTNGLHGDDDVVYSVFYDSGKIYAGSYKGGLSISSDGGNSWKHYLDDITVNSIQAIGNGVYLGTDEGIYISTDSGSSWIKKTNNLDDQSINSIYVSGGDIYAGLSNGELAVSTDGGDFSVDDSLGSTSLNTILGVNGLLFVGSGKNLYTSYSV